MEGENPITLCLETQSVFMTYQNIGIAVSFRFRVLGICNFRNNYSLHRSLGGEIAPQMESAYLHLANIMPVNFIDWSFSNCDNVVLEK